MVGYIEAVILAIIQGITEWLPVSSSGHLALAQNFLGASPPLFFDIFLHMGTLAAVIIYFRADILRLIRGFFTFNLQNPDFRWCMLIVLGSVPTAIIGFAFKGFFSSMFSSPLLVGAALLVTGLALYSTKLVPAGNGRMSGKTSVLMGIAQGFAVAPGISRSGFTISAAMLLGADRNEAARFSFLLSIPALIGAAVFEYAGSPVSASDLGPTLLGGLVSAVVGYYSIALLLDFIRQGRFSIFAWYCWALGLAAIILSVV